MLWRRCFEFAPGCKSDVSYVSIMMPMHSAMARLLRKPIMPAKTIGTIQFTDLPWDERVYAMPANGSTSMNITRRTKCDVQLYSDSSVMLSVRGLSVRALLNTPAFAKGIASPAPIATENAPSPTMFALYLYSRERRAPMSCVPSDLVQSRKLASTDHDDEHNLSIDPSQVYSEHEEAALHHHHDTEFDASPHLLCPVIRRLYRNV
jgi:hypothetical protein